LLGFLDGRTNKNSIKSFEESIKTLEEANVASSKRPISFNWVNATCQHEFSTNFGIDVGSLPNLVIYVPSRDVYANFIGTFDLESINEFIDRIIQGRASLHKITKEKVVLVDRKCEDIKEVQESEEDDELLREIIAEEMKKREEFDKQRGEEKPDKKKKKKKKKSDL
jgi:hypothetical protein